MMSHRVAIRYLLAREQLAPSIELIEKLFKDEEWSDAKDAIQLFAHKLGVAMAGTHSPETHIHTEWFSAVDEADRNMFISFIEALRAIGEVVWPRAIKAPAPDFEMFRIESLFRQLREDVRGVEELNRDESDAYKHGKFLIIPTKGVTSTTEAVKTLDEAAGHIQSKFPQVLYGKVYVRKDLRPSGSFDPRPGSGGKIAGAYQATTDTIMLSMYATPERNSVMTLIHEFGHRFHTRLLHGDKREEFIRLSTVGDVQEDHYPLAEREKFADEWIARSRTFRDDPNVEGPIHLSDAAETYFEWFPRDDFKAKVSPLSRRFDNNEDSVIPALKKALARAQYGGNLGVVRDEDNIHPVFASVYGETSWEENFAESFLAFCTGKALPKPLQAFMASI